VDFISGLQRQNSVNELSLSALGWAMLLQASAAMGAETRCDIILKPLQRE
jgi:hypothetical protein